MVIRVSSMNCVPSVFNHNGIIMVEARVWKNVIEMERSKFPLKIIVQKDDFPPPGQVATAKRARRTETSWEDMQ